MQVNGKNLTTIWYDNLIDQINIIDQRLLPHELSDPRASASQSRK